MNTQHTPGPWDAGNWNWVSGPRAAAVTYWDDTPVRHIRITAGNQVVACVATHGELGLREEADARLIAAAPDLLAALKALLYAHPVPSSICKERHAYAQALAAIEKATGAA